MTAGYIFALPLELLIGSIAGFYFSEKHKKITGFEILIAVVAQILLNVFVVWRYPNMTFTTWIHLGIFWAALSFGALLGKSIRFIVIDHVMAYSVQKKKVQSILAAFIQAAQFTVYETNPESCTTLNTKLEDVITEMHRLKSHVVNLKDFNLLNRLNMIEDSCHSMQRLSRCATNQLQENFDTDYYNTLAYQLTDLTWHTLNQIEQRTYKQLHTRAGATVAMLIKSRRD